MSEIPGPAPGWEKIEPPDHDLEPAIIDELGAEDFDGETYNYLLPSEMYALRELMDSAEHINGLAEVDLFKNVIVTSSEGELKFEVPPRIIETAKNGMWVLEVRGKREWFKEYRDYGAIRFLQNRRSIWVPHLYAFESIDENNMPEVRDRERLNVEITMKKLPGHSKSPYPMSVRVDTLNGEYCAREDLGYNYGSDTCWFLEFVHVDGDLVAHDVQHPQEEIGLTPVTDYLGTLFAKGQIDEAERYIRGEEVLPPEFDSPEPEISSDKSDLTGEPFGQLWVPVDTLRRGEVYAKISFPPFSVD